MFGSPAPHGAGGLKWACTMIRQKHVKSRPARGGWIEIPIAVLKLARGSVPPRTGRVD